MVMKHININPMLHKFDRCKKNLSYDNQFIYSYGTRVAEIKNDVIIPLGYWSRTTTKHIYYAARELNRRVV